MLPQLGCGGNQGGRDHRQRRLSTASSGTGKGMMGKGIPDNGVSSPFRSSFLCPSIPLPIPVSIWDSGKRSREGPTDGEQPRDPRRVPRRFLFGGGNDAAELAQVAGRKAPVIEQTLANRSGRCIERRKSNRPTDRPFHRPSIRGRTLAVTGPPPVTLSRRRLRPLGDSELTALFANRSSRERCSSWEVRCAIA